MRSRQGYTSSGVRWSERGDGPTLLIVSGFGTAQDALRPIMTRLARRHHCVSFDARGVGESHSLRPPLTTAGMARDALDVLDDLDVASAHVYGISLGGMVAQELALAAPERLRSLILASTSAGGWSAPTPGPLTMMRQLTAAGHLMGGLRRPTHRASLVQSWAAATHDTTARLSRIRVPTLILHGDRDHLVPPDNARILARAIPQSELVVLPGRNHMFALDPDDPATEYLSSWIIEQERPQPRALPRRSGRAQLVPCAIQAGHALRAPVLPQLRMARLLALALPRPRR